MVADGYFIINFAGIRLQRLGTKYVVNSYIESLLVVRDSEPVASCYETIGKVGGNGVMGIGYRIVVEIAAEYEFFVFVL